MLYFLFHIFMIIFKLQKSMVKDDRKKTNSMPLWCRLFQSFQGENYREMLWRWGPVLTYLLDCLDPWWLQVAQLLCQFLRLLWTKIENVYSSSYHYFYRMQRPLDTMPLWVYIRDRLSFLIQTVQCDSTYLFHRLTFPQVDLLRFTLYQLL